MVRVDTSVMTGEILADGKGGSALRAISDTRVPVRGTGTSPN